VLTYLVAQRDRVISHDELFARLWPEQFVTDDALGRCVRVARRALEDQPQAPRYIATTAPAQSIPLPPSAAGAVAKALATLDQSEVRLWEAELYRLRGELLLQGTAAQPNEAEVCFRQALAVAHRQQAKSWELRAAMSLSRLWQQQGKQAEAHELLAPVYGWFTEGFDTADLQEAKALLEELAG
jgi:Transcriptional regulatory protein, C terminal